jgi:hypothetical protein
MDSDGYRWTYRPDHPNSYKSTGSILEHRLVMSTHLGRPLRPEEEVHHKNGVRDDNQLENLELWTKSHPSGQRVSDMIEFALQTLSLYAPEMLRPAQGRSQEILDL